MNRRFLVLALTVLPALATAEDEPKEKDRRTLFRRYRDSPEEGPAAVAGYMRPTISDGDHVRARWRRLTIGGTFEHIGFREGSEWKGGGRLAVRILPRVSSVLYVLGPGRAAWRGGILIHRRNPAD